MAKAIAVRSRARWFQRKHDEFRTFEPDVWGEQRDEWEVRSGAGATIFYELIFIIRHAHALIVQCHDLPLFIPRGIMANCAIPGLVAGRARLLGRPLEGRMFLQ